jgi:hypothetical protein
MITFSLRGKMFIELMEDLRKLFLIMHKRVTEKELFRAIYISIIIFVSIVLPLFLHSKERVLSLKSFYLFIAELHLEIINLSTDFYVLYFTSFLVILQKLFASQF